MIICPVVPRDKGGGLLWKRRWGIEAACFLFAPGGPTDSLSRRLDSALNYRECVYNIYIYIYIYINSKCYATLFSKFLV